MNASHFVRAAALSAVAVLMAAAPENASAACGRPPENRPGTWCYVDGARVRVWWSPPTVFLPAQGDERTAMLVRDEVEGHLWHRYQTLLGRVPVSDANPRVYLSNGGDGRYDIMLVSDAPDGVLATPLVPSASAGTARYSKVKAGVPRTQLLGAVAHQLMHAFLATFSCRVATPLPPTGDTCRWLREATATWAEHFAYPQGNSEHRYARDFFATPTRPLHDNDGHLFGSYLFLFFLQHRGPAGTNDPDIVSRIWYATEQFPDPLAAIGHILGPEGFKAVWRDFVAANWNAAPQVIPAGSQPAPIYSAWDGLTTGVRERGGVVPMQVSAPSTRMPVKLAPLSAVYYVIDFGTAVTARSVRLSHHMLTLGGLMGAEAIEMTVFVKPAGQPWQSVANVATRNELLFCRDKADENLEQMVVIVSNADPTRTIDLAFVDPSGTDWTPQLSVGGNGCMTGPRGYQECRIVIRNQAGDPNIYHHEETQTWETFGLPVANGTSTIYDYRWATGFNGRSYKRHQPDIWWAEWSAQGTETSKVVVESASAGLQPAMRRIGGPITLSNVMIGRQTTNTAAMFSTITQNISELDFLTRTGHGGRIEGDFSRTYDLPPLSGEPHPFVYGVHQPSPPEATVTCRWSWPGA